MDNTKTISAESAANTSERTDPWYYEWLWMCAALTVFLIYATWATFQGRDYIFGPYRSPFYPFDIKWGNVSPALCVFWIPVGFRMTCYYWRKVYYRSYFRSPAGCAVPENNKGYKGETAFPFILQNSHRYFVFLALILLFFHWKETLHSFYFRDSFGIGVGNIILFLDSAFLTIYVFSCHALRHLVGGGVNQFSCASCGKARYQGWRLISILNENHGVWAWISLVSIIIADLYVRLLVWGVITDINTWNFK